VCLIYLRVLRRKTEHPVHHKGGTYDDIERFTLVLDGIEEDTLVVREYQGHESLSDTLLQDGASLLMVFRIN